MKKTLLFTIALLCMVAQGAWATDYNVGNETELWGAIENGANITLTQDITISSAITLNNGITVTIDLGGHNISNGTLTGGWGGDGGIINQATLNMTNVTITGNKGNDRGGGISNNGTLTMMDCTVSNNTSLDATDPAGGGGIFNYSGKTATLTNCTITGNTASTYGGGGICNYGTMTLENCSVKNNNANTTGGGIFCSTTSTLSINGCDITSNSAVSYGDGIYIDNSTFNMQGLCTVTGNTDSNIYLYGSGTKITVTGAFTDGSDIGVGFSDYDRKFTSGYSTYNYKYGIGEKDGEAYAGVSYVERSWTGGNTTGHVVEETKVCTDYTTYSSNTNDNSLGGGWYLLSGTFTFNKRVTIDGDVKFILQDGCNVEFDKGIFIKENKTLTIYAQSGGTGKLECPSADGDNAAIGGNADAVGGHLVIHGGTIIAKADHNNAAGIGGGNHSSGMRSVTIWGGSVEAKGKSSGAGIGAGQQNDVYCNVTIYGGTVTATGGDYAAGIGGGEDRGNGTVKIYGGTVNATGMNTGAGIGGGEKGSQDNPIYIYGGTVTATGSNSAAGIGGGSNGNCGTIEIYGGTVTATSEVNGAGIGSGNEGDAQNGTITISGGTVTASGGQYGAGIGGGAKSSGANVTISGGSVTATGGQYSAGIGAGSKGTNNGTVTITGGTVIANGGSGSSYYKNDGGAGIGGGSSSSNNATITITGGTVTVKSSEKASAIGHGGSGSSDGTLNLGSTMSVKSGNTPVSSGSRVSTLHSTGTYTIQVCDHSGGVSYTDKDEYYHHVNCTGGYCEGEDEHHIKGDGDACTKCGRALPGHTYTFYEANEEGSGYSSTGTEFYAIETKEFTFPDCGSVPYKMTFAGWELSNEVPDNLLTESTDGLFEEGSVITVPMDSGDRNYYARYTKVYFSGGSGTQSDPFLISDKEDWNILAEAVQDGYTFNGMYFQLTNNISVSTMVGQGSNRFRGKFDGQGHTITVSYTGITEDYCAPFRHISGATIKNLNTTGTIETSGRYAAGVVGYTRYYSKIENCHSSVTIRSSHAGWAGHGGILGLKADVTMSEPTIEGCVFEGKILTTGETATTGAAGIVGYTNYQTLTIKNCLYKPAALADGETAVTDGSATLYINASGAGATTVTCTDCYYTEAYGTEQGKHGYTVTSGTTGLTLDFGSATKTYENNGIEVYDFGLSYDGTLYSGSGQSVTFTPESNKEISSVAASSGTLTGPSDGVYTLTMPAANVSITDQRPDEHRDDRSE